MTYKRALTLKHDTLIVRAHRDKNRIWAVSIGTIRISPNGCGYFTTIAPYREHDEPIMNWRDYKVMTKEQREQFVLWKLENA